MMKRFANTWVFASAILLAGTATAAPTFTGLGDLPGGALFSVANAMSDNGLVVVGYSGATGDTRPFRWTITSGMVTLSGSPAINGGARDVSADGSVVVGGHRSDLSAGGAFRWSETEGFVRLVDASYVIHQSTAYAVSADGLTVGGATFPGDQLPSIWTAATGWQLQNPWSALGTTYALSADGSVAAGKYYKGQGPMAFRWTTAGGFQELGNLPGGRTSTEAHGISADGSVIVGYSEVLQPHSYLAFRWTTETGIVALESPPSGSAAYDVSADGSLVGGFGIWPTIQEAALWDESGHVHSVRELLLSMGAGDALAGWSLSDVIGISADHRTIAGNGGSPLGHAEGWIATTSPADVNGDWMVNVFDIDLVASHWREVGSAGDAILHAASNEILRTKKRRDFVTNWREWQIWEACFLCIHEGWAAGEALGACDTCRAKTST